MKKWIILLAAVLVLLAGCGKEPTITGLSNEEFHQYFAEDYARPVNNITEIAEENDESSVSEYKAFCIYTITAENWKSLIKLNPVWNLCTHISTFFK